MFLSSFIHSIELFETLIQSFYLALGYISIRTRKRK